MSGAFIQRRHIASSLEETRLKKPISKSGSDNKIKKVIMTIIKKKTFLPTRVSNSFPQRR